MSRTPTVIEAGRWGMRARRAVVLALLLLGVGGAFVTSPVDAQETCPVPGEKGEPVLTALDFQARAVNVQSGPAQVSVTAHAVDPDSGVAAVYVTFESPSGGDSASAYLVPPNSTPVPEGDLTGTLTVAPYVEAGTWKVARASVRDVAGNSKTYVPGTSDWSVAWPTDLQVTSDPDTTPPTLTTFTFQPQSVNTTNEPATVSITATATDDLSGVSSGWISFQSPSGNGSETGYLSMGDAGLTGSVTIPRWVEPGMWVVRSLSVSDRVGNTKTYAPDSEWGAGWPSNLLVVSNQDDAPPSLSAFSFQPAAVDTTSQAATVTVTAEASDDVSGVTQGAVSFVSPSGSSSSSGSLVAGAAPAFPFLPTGLDGTTTVAPDVEPGTWKVTGVSVRDEAGNWRSYAPGTPDWNAAWPTDLQVTSTPAAPTGATEPQGCVPATSATAAGAAGPRGPSVRGATASRPGGGGAVQPQPAPPEPGTGTPEIAAPAGTPRDDAPEPGNTERSRFAAGLRTPGDVSFDPGLVAGNALLAGVVVLLIAFPAEFFNKTLEENRETIRAWRWMRRLRQASSRSGAAVRQVSVGRKGLVVFLAATGVLYSFLDRNFPGGFRVLVADLVGMAAAVWVITFVYEYGASWFAHRWHGDRGALRLSPGALGVAVACVVLSRIAGFQPGYLYGLIAGVDFGGRLKDEEEGRAIGAAAALLLGVGVLSWVVWSAIDANAAGAGAGFPTMLADTALAAIFVAAIEGLLFGLFPLRFLDGEKVKKWNVRVWLALFGGGTFLFFHLLLRPSTSGYDTSTTASWAMVLGLAAAFGAVSMGLWAYFRYWAVPPPKVDLTEVEAEVVEDGPVPAARAKPGVVIVEPTATTRTPRSRAGAGSRPSR